MATTFYAQSPEGDYQGTLVVGPASLRLILHLTRLGEGGYSASIDSVDQGASGIPVETAAVEGGMLKLTLPKLRASFEGEIGASTIKGLWTQGGISLPLEFRKLDKPFELRRPQNPSPPFPYRIEEAAVSNKDAGITLAGTLIIPAGKGPFPAVVLISGSGPQDRDESLMGHKPFLVLADHLARKGIASLRYDDRGVGKSTGIFSAATSLDFANDAEAAFAWLRLRKEVDPGKAGIIGHSEGGLIAPVIAGRNKGVAFLVLLASPGVSGERILLEQATDMIKAAGGAAGTAGKNREIQSAIFRILRETKDPEQARGKLKPLFASAGVPEASLDLSVTNVNTAWFRTFLDLEPAAYLAKVRVPVLSLTGELDLQVNAAINLPAIGKALADGGNKDHEEAVLPKLNHLFQHASTGLVSEYGRIEETMAPEALDRISGWILKRFPPAAQ
jgi:hypothetical protein